MNTRVLLATIFAVALSAAPQLVSTASAGGTYSATLISPRVGQVLYPGQQIMVEWRSTLPNMNLGACERKFGCRWMAAGHFPSWISPYLNPKANLSFGLFRTCLQTRRSWTFASGVNGSTPKATLRSPHRPL